MSAIAELSEERVVEGIYAVARKQRLRTKGGAPYLALELVGISPQRRRELRRIRLRRGFERADVDLQPVPELLDAAEDSHRVALREARVEQLDVVPDARVDATAGIDELEGEVGSTALRTQSLLARDRVDALHDPLFGQLCDCAQAQV